MRIKEVDTFLAQLDQLRIGLMSSKVLPAIEKDPLLFESLFVYNAEALDADAIKGLMKPKSPLSDEHRKIWDYLFQFLDECSETGTCTLDAVLFFLDEKMRERK